MIMINILINGLNSFSYFHYLIEKTYSSHYTTSLTPNKCNNKTTLSMVYSYSH